MVISLLSFVGIRLSFKYCGIIFKCFKLQRITARVLEEHGRLLAWLNGLQSNPFLANHEERARDLRGYFKTVELAAEARLFTDADLAVERIETLSAYLQG